MTDSSDEVETILQELAQFLHDSVFSTVICVMGLLRLGEYVVQFPRSQENPDPRIFIGSGPPGQVGPFGVRHMSEVLNDVAKGGPVETTLGQQWLVSVFTAWEHNFRRRLATAHGVDESQITAPVLGDLRHLRNDVVHHHGIATAENTGKCLVLRHWVAVGDPIRLSGEHFDELMRIFPLDSLGRQPGPG
jgi:hypothetical protein